MTLDGLGLSNWLFANYCGAYKSHELREYMYFTEVAANLKVEGCVRQLEFTQSIIQVTLRKTLYPLKLEAWSFQPPDTNGVTLPMMLGLLY